MSSSTSPYPIIDAAEIARLSEELVATDGNFEHGLGWLDAVEVMQPPEPRTADHIDVAVFNIERGNRYEGVADLIRSTPRLRNADIYFLNEVDHGMARSGNRHIAFELSRMLGTGFAYGVEFFELTKGEAHELDAPGENSYALHGNAILSRLPLQSVRVVRLPRRCSWAAGSQLRLGGRMALVAEVMLGGQPLTISTVHLENRTSPSGRLEQMQPLLDAVGNGPAIIGGDLNTSTIDAGIDSEIFSIPDLLARDAMRLKRPQPHEPLFDAMRAAGYAIDELNPDGIATSVPLGIPDPYFWLKLDWLFARGLSLEAAEPQIIQATIDGNRVSDHDIVIARIGAAR